MNGIFSAAELGIAMEIGERLLICGAEVSRVEDTITRICRAYGARRVDVFTITSSIVVSAWGEGDIPVTQTRRVNGLATDLHALSELNDLSRRICENRPSGSEVTKELNKIDARPRYGFKSMLLIWLMVSAAFSIFFGGSWKDAAASAVIGVILKLLQAGLGRLKVPSLLSTLICSVVGGMGAYAAVYMQLADSASSISIGNIMLLIPGIALTNSIRDMFSGDTISGLLRFTEALILSIFIAWGFAIPAMF